MTHVTMIAIEPCNSHRPGDSFSVPEREAEQLVRKGLAKINGPHENKMAPPGDNKANPTGTAGAATSSSASRAGRASPRKTAGASRAGAKKEPAGE
ncbi:hypothetical protein ACQQ2N_12165 [Dokdonella sp. MW10]|uniref:hypothetical protein n=1 Tax=Dokdonella sp. MW10 TaxID=2992926 RepID=UPI003F82016A